MADDGPGFPEAVLPVAFDRFTRAEAARSHDAGAGAGLGLAIVAAIVRAHGGTISAANGPPLGGAAVMVRLPSTRPAPSPNRPEAGGRSGEAELAEHRGRHRGRGLAGGEHGGPLDVDLVALPAIQESQGPGGIVPATQAAR